MRFSNKNVQLLGGNFYGRNFTRRELSSHRECYQDFASRQDSRQDPGKEFFFLAGFLPRYAAGIFPRKDPAGKVGHLDRIPVSAVNLGRIPARSRYLFARAIQWYS